MVSMLLDATAEAASIPLTKVIIVRATTMGNTHQVRLSMADFAGEYEGAWPGQPKFLPATITAAIKAVLVSDTELVIEANDEGRNEYTTILVRRGYLKMVSKFYWMSFDEIKSAWELSDNKIEHLKARLNSDDGCPFTKFVDGELLPDIDSESKEELDRELDKQLTHIVVRVKYHRIFTEVLQMREIKMANTLVREAGV